MSSPILDGQNMNLLKSDSEWEEELGPYGKSDCEGGQGYNG